MMYYLRHQISELNFGKFPDSVGFQCWRVNIRTEVCENTPWPQLTMSWINGAEIAKSTDDLMTSQSTQGKDFPDFEMLDAKIASALRKIISSSNFNKRVSVEEQRGQKHDRFLRGTQIAYRIHDRCQAIGACDAAQGLSDLFNICFHDDGLQDFDTRLDQVLLTTSEIPEENVFEGLYKMKLQGSAQHQTALAVYDQGMNRDRVLQSYQRLRTLVRRHIDQMIRTRNVEARNERIETVV